MCFCCWSIWAVCIFWKLSPCQHIFCKYFLSFSKLSFFMDCFAVKKLVNLIGFYLFLFLLILPWGADQRKHWYNLCQEIFFLWSLLGVLWRSLSHFEFILCTVRWCVLTSLIYMQLSNVPKTICWRDFFPLDIFAPFFKD